MIPKKKKSLIGLKTLHYSGRSRTKPLADLNIFSKALFVTEEKIIKNQELSREKYGYSNPISSVTSYSLLNRSIKTYSYQIFPTETYSHQIFPTDFHKMQRS